MPARPAEAGADEEMNFDLETDFGDLDKREIGRRAAVYLALLAGFGLVAWAIGVVAAIPVYLLVQLKLSGERWPLAIAAAVIGAVVAEGLFNRLLSLGWPPALWPLGF